MAQSRIDLGQQTKVTSDYSFAGFRLTNIGAGNDNNDVVNFGQLALKLDLSQKGIANGVAALGADGKILAAHLPDLTGRKEVVADEAARLALPVDGDLSIIVQADTGGVYALNPDADPAVAGNWTLLGYQAGKVSSFNGREGAVLPTTGDYTAGQITVTPTGDIAATDLQAALAELDTEKLSRVLATGWTLMGLAGAIAAVHPIHEEVLTVTGTTATLAYLPAGKVTLYHEGVHQREGAEQAYTISGKNVTFTFTPAGAVWVNYDTTEA
ncbi:MAG: Uncharacterized protein FD149_1557 [Rhodospirillaceae bacterium]|nr:MAG: Uncharacterized protein FD149_1557 [Rhodospirillaceae bacterium]